MNQSDPLHIKYRPQTLEDVIGQPEVVRSLQKVLESNNVPHSFLFTGPSGTGKTTLARIISRMLNCDPSNVLETDAATNTGIDAMRAITDLLRYKPFGELPNKMVVLDECHALSKNAWQSLLKVVEEPPAHVYFAFCTTDNAKVPETIRTRCVSYDLKSVRLRDLQDLLVRVCDAEKFDTSDEIIDLVAITAGGSVRQALVMLLMVAHCKTKDEAATVLSQPLENAQVIDLCRMMVGGRGFSWPSARRILQGLRDENPEAVRIIIVNYLNSVILNTESERDMNRLLDLLAAFSRPLNPSDKLAPIILAVGDMLFPRG